MNAGELVVSLILSAGTFLAEVRKSESALDNVRDAAREAGKAVSDAAATGSADIGVLGSSARNIGRDISNAAERSSGDIARLGSSARNTGGELEDAGKRGGRGLDDLGSSAREAGKELEDAGNRGALSFERLKGVAAQALAVIGGVSILKSSIAQYYEQAQAIEKTSDALGMSIEDWQAWQRTAAAAGVDAEELSTRFMDLGDWMQDLILHDSGPLKDATKDLGVSFTDAKGKAVSFEEGLLRLSDATSKIDRQKATSILTQIGFDEKTIPLILKGRKGIEDLLKVQKAQAIYSKQDIENAKKQREAQQRLNDAWEAISALFASTVSPGDHVFDEPARRSPWVGKRKQAVRDRLLYGVGRGHHNAHTPGPDRDGDGGMGCDCAVYAVDCGHRRDRTGCRRSHYLHQRRRIRTFRALVGVWNRRRNRGSFQGHLGRHQKYPRGRLGCAFRGRQALQLRPYAGRKRRYRSLKTIWGGISKINDVLVEMLNWVAQKLYNLLPDWIKDWLGGDESSRPEETKAEAKPGGVADSMRVGDVRPSILPPQVRAGDARPGSVSNVNNSRQVTSITNRSVRCKVYTQAH